MSSLKHKYIHTKILSSCTIQLHVMPIALWCSSYENWIPQYTFCFPITVWLFYILVIDRSKSTSASKLPLKKKFKLLTQVAWKFVVDFVSFDLEENGSYFAAGSPSSSSSLTSFGLIRDHSHLSSVSMSARKLEKLKMIRSVPE